MTWQEEKRDAALKLDALIQEIGRDAILNSRVPVPFYESQDVLDLMQPGNTWTVQYHQQVARALVRMLVARTKAKLMHISLADYQQWLDNREDTPQTRAEFISYKKSTAWEE